MRRASLVLAAVSAALLAACDGASSDPGLGALLRVEGAQFVEDRLPRAAPVPRWSPSI